MSFGEAISTGFTKYADFTGPGDRNTGGGCCSLSR